MSAFNFLLGVLFSYYPFNRSVYYCHHDLQNCLWERKQRFQGFEYDRLLFVDGNLSSAREALGNTIQTSLKRVEFYDQYQFTHSSEEKVFITGDDLHVSRLKKIHSETPRKNSLSLRNGFEVAMKWVIYVNMRFITWYLLPKAFEICHRLPIDFDEYFVGLLSGK